MFIDGLGDHRLFAGQQGVLPPHYPLEFREFTHHLRVQIRLGQDGGAIHRRREAGIDPGGDKGGQLAEPENLFV